VGGGLVGGGLVGVAGSLHKNTEAHKNVDKNKNSF